MPHHPFDRRTWLKAALAAVSGAAVAPLGGQGPLRSEPPSRARTRLGSRSGRPPNIVFILADDLGYGDVGCYGSSIPTPNLDRLASEGVRLTQFYSASPVCSPSRAALLTGRYPTRVGIQRVLFPSDTIGIAESETTLPAMLKTQGYRTACIGKWHLGAQPEFLPTSRGFDEFFGLPYSGDMLPRPLMRNTAVIEQPARLDTLTQRYTDEAVSFLVRSRDVPFFLYLSHNEPHIPLIASEPFRGQSGLGPYGDVVMEMDWSVGEVLRALHENGLAGNTLVIFTSDNGPWYQGSPGRLRGRKGETYEGGVREPFLARFPGRIPPGLESHGVASMLDVLPTLAGLTGAALPGKSLDGVDVWPLLIGQQPDVSRDVLLYFDDWNLQCARWGRWKVHLSRYNSVAWGPSPPEGRLNLPLPRPELYDLEADPGESYDVASQHPEIVAQIRARVMNLLPGFPAAVNTAWQDTQNYRVQDTPDGALPVRSNP